jgi:photosystem II stability/assembly factor-like uncharacterized protein
MRSKVIILLLAMCITAPITVFARDMIYTYWHQLDGPYWIYKPQAISISNNYVYTFGGNKENQFKISLSTDNGESWTPQPRNDYPANCISASTGHPRDAYYTSPGNNVFNTFNAGTDWGAPTTPPDNLAFTVCAANPIHADTALVGCGYSTDGGTIWKTTNHGQTWTDIDFIANTVNDIVWHGTNDQTFYVATDGENPPAIWNSTDGGVSFNSLDASGFVSASCITTKILNNTNYIVACGIFEEAWAIKFFVLSGLRAQQQRSVTET